MSAPIYDPVQVARQFRHVREAPSVGQNRGLRVEAIQHWSNGQFGESWCADFAWMVLDIAYQGNCPMPRTGSTQLQLSQAIAKGWVVETPQINDLFYRVHPSTKTPHHVGFVTRVYPDRIGTIAGNTSDDGLSSNGDGVHEHDVRMDTKTLVFVRLPL